MMIDHSVIEKEAAFAEEMKGRALKAEKQLAELREAAQPFVDAIIAQAARCVLCEEEGKSEPVMLREGLRMACDAHGRELLIAPKDLSYAPALRRLRALLAG